jgi:hypothetical protein
MVILRTLFAIAAVAGWIYWRVRMRQQEEETRKRKIHVHTLFAGEDDRHLNE